MTIKGHIFTLLRIKTVLLFVLVLSPSLASAEVPGHAEVAACPAEDAGVPLANMSMFENPLEKGFMLLPDDEYHKLRNGLWFNRWILGGPPSFTLVCEYSRDPDHGKPDHVTNELLPKGNLTCTAYYRKPSRRVIKVVCTR